MKQPKRLTRNQKIMLSQRGVDPKGLYRLRELPNSLIVKDKATGEIKVIEKITTRKD